MKKFLLAFMLVCFSSASAFGASEAVSLVTPDGMEIKGDFLRNEKARASILLIHMLGRSKEDWATFAAFLFSNQYEVLAIDLRGHGESRGVRGNKNWADFSDLDFRLMLEDTKIAWKFLKAQKETPKPMFVVGASIGANLALMLASQEESVEGVVLLSPGLDYRGLKTPHAMGQYGNRPLFVATSLEDQYSLRSTRYLLEIAQSEDETLREFPAGAGHGTDMLLFRSSDEEKADLSRLLFDWLNVRVSNGAENA